MTSWMCPCARCERRMASRLSTRSRRVSPMPTRMPGRERDAQPPGRVDHRQPPVGPLVGRAMVRHPRLAEARARALEHQAEAHVHFLEPRHVRVGQEARVRVRQEPVRERLRARPSAGTRPCSSARARRACGGTPRRPSPACRRGRRAPRRSPSSRARDRAARSISRGRHRPLARVARRAAERAVVAVVSAEVGERKKDLRRVGHHPPEERVAHARAPRRGRPPRRSPVGVGERERLFVRERRAERRRARALAHRAQPIAETDVGSIS